MIICSVAQARRAQIAPPPAPAAGPNPAEKCIEDICGPPEKASTFWGDYYDLIERFTKEASRDIRSVEFPESTRSLINAIGSAQREASARRLAIFARVSEDDPTPPSGLARGLLNFSALLPRLKQYQESLSQDGKTELDETALRGKLADLPEPERSWTAEALKFIRRAPEPPVSDADRRSLPLDVLLKTIHQHLSANDAIKREFDEASAATASVQKKSGLEKTVFLATNGLAEDRLTTIGDHLRDGSIDEDDVRSLVRFNIGFRSTKYFWSADSPLMKREPGSLGAIVRKGGGKEALMESIKRFDEFRTSDFVSNYANCRAQYYMNRRALPNQAQVDRLQRDIDQARELAKDVIRQRFPADVQRRLFDAVDDSKFLLPPTADQYKSRLNLTLRRRLESVRAENDNFDRLEDRDVQGLLTAMAALTDQQSTAANEQDKFCSAFDYEPMSDGNYTAVGRIVLSYTTATGPQLGRRRFCTRSGTRFRKP